MIEPEVIDYVFQPGTYYLGIDAQGTMFDYGPYSFKIRFYTVAPDGSPCTGDLDCQSIHCQNGYCCQQGDCCPSNDTQGALKCPASCTVPPTCESTSECEGDRKDPVCVNYMCGSVLVQDDCACAGEVANNCGLYIPVYCPAPPNQPDPDAPQGTCTQSPYPVSGPGRDVWQATDPQCLTSCNDHGQGPEDDSLCDDIAHCDLCTEVGEYCTAQDVAEGNAVCKGDLPYGYPCNKDSDCQNYSDQKADGHCQNGYCCLAGDCCATDLSANCDPQQFPYGCPNPDVCPILNPRSV